MDLATRKMLCLHIPSLLPHTISEYDHAPCVQNAAVMGIGLLYQGTVHRLMAEFLIGEVGRRPGKCFFLFFFLFFFVFFCFFCRSNKFVLFKVHID